MITHYHLVTILVVFLSQVLAAPKPAGQHIARDECQKKTARKPWQLLKPNEQKAFLEAELCLMKSPPKLDIPGAQNRWDELQYNHIIQTNFVHDVGAFLPWHRYFVTVHGNLLRDECGYNGPIPYWDETADVGKLSQSVIFKSEAFGGNGVGGGNDTTKKCITDGPFANTTLRLKRLYEPLGEYCIYRNFNETSFQRVNQTNVDQCFAINNYTSAWECWHKEPHGGGHAGVAGLMVDPVLSPGDPLFYMHHGWLDAMWWKWQSMDLSNRLTDMGGRNVITESYRERLNLTFPGPEFTEYDGDPGNVTTLDHVLWVSDLAPNATIRDVMDVGGPVICAEYFYDE